MIKFRAVIALCCCIVFAVSGVFVSYAADQEGETKEPSHLYIPILMYHHFVKEPVKGAMGATITEEKFQEDMNYLANNKYTPLLPQDLKAILAGKKTMPKNPIMITFDDGYESVYNIAYPILEKTGMKATVFAIVASVESPKKAEIKKLSWEQMAKMYGSGLVDIQSHSYNLHNQDLKGQYKKFQINGIQRGIIECQAQYELRVEEDIVKSVELIEANIGNEVIAFAYPYGVYDDWGVELLKQNGILFGFGTVYGAGDLKGNLYYLNRFSVGMNTDLSGLLEQ
ncbi:polysaccharide deacetylase family protein [Aminipila butyrica]|uniref:Polysaccharide deacetylase family protein n=1 Tax=Aminipila butyrica TaxID=433296 RepID=A0A858BUS8_9FIRM|nr:polysaccharide deacetylase family protein [Aminipila butyrica]QIB68534.1 polysaccharide deacetylase family protein [Aminipila butyrica]